MEVAEINNNGETNGPRAVYDELADPQHPPGPNELVSIWTYAQQQHFTYRSGLPGDGNIIDAFWGGTEKRWFIQTIIGPLATGDPFACVFVPSSAPHTNGQQHIGYRDFSGTIWNPWYDPVTNKWNLQQINVGGRTNGPPAVGGPFVWAYSNSISGSDFQDQLHFTYRDINGVILDSWYDGATNNWNLQQINLGGKTDAPQAVGDPFVSVFFAAQQVLQQHIAYRDNAGAIWDCFYDSQSDGWTKQQINLGGITHGPAAVTDPFVWVYSAADGSTQQHFTYLPGPDGEVWDAFWDLPGVDPVQGRG